MARKKSFPAGANLRGGQAAAPLNRQAADEFYAPILPLVLDLHRAGRSLREIARELEGRGVKARFGSTRWAAAQVRRLVKRAEDLLQAAPVGREERDQAPEEPLPSPSPPPEPVTAEAPLFLWQGMKKQGPFSTAEVLHMLEAGKVKPATLARRDGEADWRPLRELLDLPGA